MRSDLVPMGVSYHCYTRSDYCLQSERRGVCLEGIKPQPIPSVLSMLGGKPHPIPSVLSMLGGKPHPIPSVLSMLGGKPHPIPSVLRKAVSYSY